MKRTSGESGGRRNGKRSRDVARRLSVLERKKGLDPKDRFYFFFNPCSYMLTFCFKKVSDMEIRMKDTLDNDEDASELLKIFVIV